MSKKIYKYNIDTNSLGSVRAEIYYVTTYGGAGRSFESEVSSGGKRFNNLFFRGHPNEKELVAAKTWAIEQCRIMNENQPDE